MATTCIEITGQPFEYDDAGDRKTGRRFLIQGDPSLTEKQAIDAISVLRFDSLSADAYQLAKTCVAKRVPDETSLGLFIVEVGYTTKLDKADKADPTSNPIESDKTTAPPDRPYKTTWGVLRIDKHLGPQDKTSPAARDVVNSAGQPITGIVGYTYHQTFTVSGYCAIADLDIVQKQTDYHGTINNATYIGYDALTLLCTNFTAETEYEQGSYFWHFSVSFEYNPDFWNPVKVYDMGTMYKFSNNQPLQPILDRSGHPIKEAIFLDGFGQPLPANGAPVILEFKQYDEATWTNILDFS